MEGIISICYVIISMRQPFQWSYCSLVTVNDWEFRTWPWQLFALGKGGFPLFVISNRCIPAKSALGWSAVVFCACQIIQLLFSVFSVVTAAYRRDCRLVISEIRKKWRQMKEGLTEMTALYFNLIYIYFSPTFVANVKGLYRLCEGQLHSLE
jgi:hypothetical protein